MNFEQSVIGRCNIRRGKTSSNGSARTRKMSSNDCTKSKKNNVSDGVKRRRCGDNTLHDNLLFCNNSHHHMASTSTSCHIPFLHRSSLKFSFYSFSYGNESNLTAAVSIICAVADTAEGRI